MAIAAVTTTSQVFGGSGGTTTGITTTGADLIIVALTYYKGTGANLSDSKGNTWSQLTKYEEPGSNSAVVIYYSSNPSVGASHTFTTTSHFCGVNVLAVSGSRTASSPYDQVNGNTKGTSTTSEQPGSITPSVSGCVFVTCVMQQGAGVSAPTIPSGYTSIGTYPTGTAYAGGAAYKILTDSSAQNVAWTGLNTSTNIALCQADFMPPAVAPTTDGKFFSFF